MLWRYGAGDAGHRRTGQLIHGKYRLPCDISEALQRQFYFFGTYFLEQHLLECWVKMASGADVIFDVGANAGIYSLAALSSNSHATVHAFEPTPEIAARLRQAVELNELNQLKIHEVAVLDKPRRAALIRCRANDGMNFIRTQGVEGQSEIVPAESLDAFCSARGIGDISLMKIDVQGHEHSVLRGAKSLLEGGRIAVIFMELNWAPESRAGCPATESVRLLESLGFRFAKPGAELKWEKSGDWLRKLSDIIARQAES